MIQKKISVSLKYGMKRQFVLLMWEYRRGKDGSSVKDSA